ncbi:Elongation of very long chain fatty acids protein 6 [Phytophthora nicotianae]|uniref:Elongation of very long chain fatty acids protein 6 n=1 Tax=Phytophthora nicotianae TaxID=4792 RepID=A0A0W8D412_PHYNI|nr:Elongation of very long chain fatty acids protein 6 [Phytophthora nicotianae]
MVAKTPADACQPMCASIEYDSGKTLMAQGSQALHDHVAYRMEKALGGTLPQMEVRFKNVSISVDVVVKDETDIKVELPTLSNELLKSVRGLCAKKHTVKKQILKNVSGIFKPGTINLVLGQPGSGKFSLMKLLSGRFPDHKNITIEGEVTYNGTPVNELLRRLPQFVSYVTQRDKHYPSLTVKETLEFAHACCGGGFSERDAQHFVNGTPEENKDALDAARSMSKHHPDIVIQQLGLDNCESTIVGDAMTRGVSGGERKRVTTGEMEFGNKYVMMMDEISTGLDSAATFDIIATQRSLAKKFRKTVVISLLQPSPEVFELFDNVVILNEGYVMYHGPRAEASGYFEGLGFKCPPHRDVADFLLDLGTDKQAQYEVNSIRSSSIPRSASQYADLFARSTINGRMMEDLRDPVHPSLIKDKVKHMDPIPEFHQNFWNSTITVVQRQITLTTRDRAFLVGRSAMIILMGLLYSSVFYQIDEANAQLMMGIIVNAVMFVSLGQQAQIPIFMAAREVFYKQRRANFFRTASFVLSNSLENNYNPATWMLEVIGAGVGNTNGDTTDFVEIFQSSKHFELLQANLDREGISRPSPLMSALEFSEKRAASELTQAKFLIQRFFNMYWRTASYNLTRFFLALTLGLMFGVTYVDAEYTSYAGINSGMGMLYCTTGFFGFITFSSVMPMTSQDRLVFYRERAAQTYNALWYFVGSTVVEIPYVFFSTMLLLAPYYPMAGFTGATTFFTYWFHLSLHVLWHAYFGQLMSYLAPTVEVATIFGTLIQMIFFLFIGFNPPGGSIPRGYKWLFHITPHKYSLALVASLAFGDCPSDGDGSEIGCHVMTGLPPSLPENMTVKGYIGDVFAMKHSEIWKNFGFVLGFIVVYRLLALFALRFVNHQKK